MNAARKLDRSAEDEAAIWQELEFGAYVADLPVWEELASSAGGPVLELGSGSGRVALHLARLGHDVIALERDPALAAALRGRAAAEDVPVAVVEADIAELGEALLPAPASAAIAPLHVIQQIEPAERPALLAALAGLLPPGGRFAAAVVDEPSLEEGSLAEKPVPDMRELEGWVYSSEPLWVQLAEATMTVRRLRERVSPDGEIERSVHDDQLHRLPPAALERESAEAGLAVLERRPIRSGPAEADSIAIVMEAP